MSQLLLSTLERIHAESFPDDHIKTNKHSIEFEFAKILCKNASDTSEKQEIQQIIQVPGDLLVLIPEEYPGDNSSWIKVFYLRLKRKLRKQPLSQEEINILVQRFYSMYQVDEIFRSQATSSAKYITSLFDQAKLTENDENQIYLKQSRDRLFLRCLLLKVSNYWDKENCDQPILWKVGEILKDIASCTSSQKMMAATNSLKIIGLQERAIAKNENPVEIFLSNANDEKSGSILDNLLISLHSFKALEDNGWEPDRWEIENLPIALDLLIQYLMKNGYCPEGAIGEEIMIGLQDSLENFRYTGTPFVDQTDKKRVKVLAPGWKFQDRLIVRPKVREISK